ncbi:uncharacterized protein LOC142325733 [Lycorma delicatula]|uniref:uncharacterized protein LOC142325733 n=1 Tax=Lycorma delicatula TaxID=130591 RepID=UPI003F51013C
MDHVKRKCSNKNKKNNGDDDDDAYLIDYSALMNLPKSIILEAIEYAKRKRDEEDRKEKDENEYIRLKCIPPWAKTYGGKRIESCITTGTQYEIEEIASSISEISKTDIDELTDLEESEKISEEKRDDEYEGEIVDIGEEIITELATDETEHITLEEAKVETDVEEEKPTEAELEEEKPTTEAELEEEKPTSEAESEEEKPTEVELEEEKPTEVELEEEKPTTEDELEEEKPTTEVELEEEKPTTEIELEEEKPTTEIESEEEKPTAEIESEEEKPTAEFETEEEKPTAEIESEEEKPTAEFETEEEKLLEAEKLDSEVETKDEPEAKEIELDEEPEIEQILETEEKDLKDETEKEAIQEEGEGELLELIQEEGKEEESLEELAKYEETEAVMEELTLEGKEMKRTKEIPHICKAEGEAELTEELPMGSEEKHEILLDEHKDKEAEPEDKLKAAKPTKDTAYIKRELGNVLVKALAEIAWRRPHDPVHFLAHRLYHEYKRKQVLEEEMHAIKILEGEKQRLQVAGDILIKSFGNIERASSLPVVEPSVKDESYETSEDEREVQNTVYKNIIDSAEETTEEEITE